MVLQNIKIEDFNVLLDPENNFWTIYDHEIPDRIIETYRRLKNELDAKMEKYRSEVDFNTVYLNITERCNANCPYCYIPHEIRRRGKEIDVDLLSDILNSLAELGIKNVVFHGAEPLLSKDKIFEIVENFGNELGFGIQTNAFLLTEEDSDFLKEKRINVGISFDSTSENVEDFLRGKGHYRKVNEVLEWFSGYRGFHVITTITSYNVNELDKIIDYLAGKVELILMNPVRGTSLGGRNLRPDPNVCAEGFIKAVERAIWHTKNGKRITIGDFANVLLGIVSPYSRVLQCDISPCGGGRRFFAITPEGVFPCSEFIGLEDFRQPLSILKDPEKIKTSFANLKGRRVECIDDCRECAFRNICGSPCPAEVYAEKGSLIQKSPYCDFYKKVIEHAFKVIRRGDLGSVLRLERLRKVYEIFET
ncbi:MAG: uncharacterized protein PWQ58_1252 [Archaeoglobaceae archaeon]|nr:uncharacterized protein [Archaeoglobaceae archaeon]